ncbi:MAG TPA: O-antigen ligase family protein [Solirubrobacteraceae bacterium]|jgi:O-antigen ligase|nr:O-antigen ligase family protein [Solirubrobacteraceae bacterium]
MGSDMTVIIVRSMTSRLMAPLRQVPTTAPALLAVALLVIGATDQAGYPMTHWAPAAITILALLAIAAAVVRVPLAELSLPLKIALGCLAAFTALSFLSIIWADVPGVAWEGANRTLLYLLVFALFACWRQRGVNAAVLLSVWTLSIVGLALFVLLHIGGLSAAGLRSELPEGRLTFPSGYANANAALWLMAFWPALLLARSSRLPSALRGLLAGGAVLLALVALLSQSRGSLYAMPVMLVLVFALLPDRVRTFAVGIPIAAGVALAARPVLHVGDDLTRRGAVDPSTLHSARTDVLAAAIVVGLVVAAAAELERRSRIGEQVRARLHRAAAAIVAIALVLAVAGGLVAAGNPVTRLEHAWHSFKGGYSGDQSHGSRLTSGLGSNRYDFYRVALDEFVAHPLIGIGADNFEQQYLARGHSEETPHYPHSLELRTLAQTGLLGALLALAGLVAALIACARAVYARPRVAGSRAADPLAPAVAAASLAAFGYWTVHGSFDWFWEFAGLGAPAFALLGLACSLAPARAREAGHQVERASADGHDVEVAERAGRVRARRTVPRAALLAAAAVLALGAVYSLGAPWLAQLQLQEAAKIWPQAPRKAYSRLHDAANLNPLSDEPYLLAGTIALRFGDLARADHEFALALKRTPGDAYATLERGAIASSRGERQTALSLLARTVSLTPREPLAREALEVVRDGRRLNVAELNRAILLKAQQLA